MSGRAHGVRPRTSTDGETLDWFVDANGYAIDAPDWICAGSTMGRTPATPARGRRTPREGAIGFEVNPLIYAA